MAVLFTEKRDTQLCYYEIYLFLFCANAWKRNVIHSSGSEVVIAELCESMRKRKKEVNKITMTHLMYLHCITPKVNFSECRGAVMHKKLQVSSLRDIFSQ